MRKMKAEAEGELRVGLPIHLKHDFEVGAEYRNSKWGGIKEYKDGSKGVQFDKLGIEAEAKVEAEAGIFLKTNAMLYRTAGPYVIVGPVLTSELEGKAVITVEEQELSLSAKIGLLLRVEGGVEVKVWKWELAKYALPAYNSPTLSLYEKSWTFPEK